MNTTRIAVLPLILTLAPIATFAAMPQVGQSNARPDRIQPNILFIVSDDHGWGDLSSHCDKIEVIQSEGHVVSKTAHHDTV